MPAALLFLLLALPLAAQDIQRCERDGKVSYTDQACPPESAQRALRPVQLDTETERSAQARLAQQRKQLAQQEQQDLKQAQADARAAAKQARRQQEQQHKDAQAAARRQKQCQASQQKLQWMKDDLAQAGGVAREKQLTRLRRAEQLHLQHCPT